jgi:hypothetical protein
MIVKKLIGNAIETVSAKLLVGIIFTAITGVGTLWFAWSNSRLPVRVINKANRVAVPNVDVTISNKNGLQTLKSKRMFGNTESIKYSGKSA